LYCLGYSNWYSLILGFATQLVQSFTISPSATQVGVVKFSDVASISFYLNQYTDNTSLVNAIQALPILGGETNIADALDVTRYSVNYFVSYFWYFFFSADCS